MCWFSSQKPHFHYEIWQNFEFFQPKKKRLLRNILWDIKESFFHKTSTTPFLDKLWFISCKTCQEEVKSWKFNEKYFKWPQGWQFSNSMSNYIDLASILDQPQHSSSICLEMRAKWKWAPNSFKKIEHNFQKK